MRALHQRDDGEPKILTDPIVAKLVDIEGPDSNWVAPILGHPFAKQWRTGFLIRSRYAEDCLAEGVARGLQQYLILGAGLDTFAYRQPTWARAVGIFELDEAAHRLRTIPGIGVLNATALVAAIGHGESFACGRDLAAWLGLVPRQVTTGGKPRLAGISKRSNKYLRKLLIHGARAALPTLLESPTPLGGWLRGLIARMHKNAAVVALANKLARIAWAVLRYGESFSIDLSTTA
jgi:hypothetical protein